MFKQMKTHHIVIAVSGCVLLVFFGWWLLKRDGGGLTSTDCIEGRQTFVQGNESMKGLIEVNQEVEAEMGYYKCNAPNRGDVVVYRFSASLDPVLRRVVAVADVKFELEKAEEQKCWVLLVNGEEVRGADRDFVFGGEMPPTLSLYIQERNGVLREGELIVFANLPPGREDSTLFGIVAQQDILGKVLGH